MTSGAERIGRGITLRITCALLFSMMSALLKLATTRGVGAFELVFYRAAFALPVVLAWVVLGPGLPALRTQRPWAHIGRCILGVSTIFFTFQALAILPLADAATIGFTAPVFATILSWLVLGERVGRYRWAAVLFGFVGVAVVTRPGAGGHALPAAGVAFALVSALGTAGVTVTLRQLRATEQVAAIVFWFFVASALAGAVTMLFVARPHDPLTFLILAGAGLCGGLAQLAMTASLQQAPVAVLAPFDYLQLVGAIVLGWLLLSSVPTLATLGGAALIAGSGLYTAWREHHLRRDRPVPATQPLT